MLAHVTKEQLRAGGVTFDTELPNDWFKHISEVTNSNPYNHIVWAYPWNDGCGGPLPVTERGAAMLIQVFQDNI